MKTRGLPGMLAPRYQECGACGSSVASAAALTSATHLSTASGRGFDALDAVARMCGDAVGDPLHVLLDRDRHVAQHRRAAGAGDGEQVRETRHLQAEIVARARCPGVRERQAVAAANVHAQQRAGHGVEAGGEDDDVQRDTRPSRVRMPFGVMASMGSARTSTSVTLSRLKVSK